MKTSAKYNKSIEFWKADLVSDGMGGSYPSYVRVFADYANIIPKHEKRGLQEGQLVLVGYFDISIRFNHSILLDKSIIIKHSNDFYTIHSIINNQDKEYLITCTQSDPISEIFENENPYEQPYTPPPANNTLPYILA